MTRFIVLFAIVLSIAACKNDKKSMGEDGLSEELTLDSTAVDETTSEVKDMAKAKKMYPSQLQNVFAAHGNLDRWQKMNNLCFEMKGKNGEETHTVSLADRKTKIESKDWSIGYDGEGVWLLKHDLDYQGNPVFYHNLMFYFYAMPFVIADPGTNYLAVEPKEFEGKMYSGFKISYNEGVGDSSKDEYILYFDPDTSQMTWLAYTVTFRDQQKSDDWHFIKYDKWQEVNGLLLPEKFTFWTVEDGKPVAKKRDYTFKKISATETKLDATVFAKPSEAEYVNK